MDEQIKIIRVNLTNGTQRIRAAGWYRVFGQLVLYTIQDGKRKTVAEFDNDFVLSVWYTACEIGKAVE